MLSLLIALRMEMNVDDWNKYISRDSELPFFCMLHAPWCHSCRAIHPTWKLVQEEYADDPNIMLGSMNCEEFPVCAMNRVSLFPTFVEFYKGEFANTTDENKSVENFQYLADRLIERKNGAILQSRPERITRYPAFVFEARSDANYSAIHVLKRAAILSEMQIPFYLRTNPDTPEIPKVTALVDPKRTVEFDQVFTVKNVKEFLVQNANLIDLDWTMESLKKSSLPFAVFASSDSKSFAVVKKLARKMPGKFAWGNARNLREVEIYFGLRREELPAILIINATNWTFSLMRMAIEIHKMRRFLSSDQNKFFPIKSPKLISVWIIIAGTGLAIACGVVCLLWIVFRHAAHGFKHD
jgi:thiol-disulfide isomerase/thioredoxin